jgi:hypothetical protein
VPPLNEEIALTIAVGIAENAQKAAIIMTQALGRIATEDFNHPAHAANIARKALREAKEILESDG